MCARPAFMRSASATSSADCRSTVSVPKGFTIVPFRAGLKARTTTVVVRTFRSALMCQPVHDVVDAEFEGLVRFLDGPEAGSRELPEVRDVRVEIDDGQQALPGIVVLEQPAEDRSAAIVV